MCPSNDGNTPAPYRERSSFGNPNYVFVCSTETAGATDLSLDPAMCWTWEVPDPPMCRPRESHRPSSSAPSREADLTLGIHW